MGYRDDDTALQSRRDVLQREIQPLEDRLQQLGGEADRLRQTVRRRRLRITLNRMGHWATTHPKTMVLLVLVVGITAWVMIAARLQTQRERQRLLAITGHGCKTLLQVDASHPARLSINGVAVGTVPQELPVCPGAYRLQLTHDRLLPWQRLVRVTNQARLRFDVPMLPFDPSERPSRGVVVFSTPPGALLFANGHELGYTPLVIDDETLARPLFAPPFAPPGPIQRGLLLALWSGLGRVFVWRGKPRPATLWFHLDPPAPATPEKRHAR